jgi:hypothetical protein
VLVGGLAVLGWAGPKRVGSTSGTNNTQDMDGKTS